MLYIKQTNREEKLTRVLGSFCQVSDPCSCSQHTNIRTKQTCTLIKTCLRVGAVIDLRAERDVDTRSRFSETSRSLKFDQERLSDPAPAPDCQIVPQSPFGSSAAYFCFCRSEVFHQSSVCDHWSSVPCF